jgi:dolichol-phosphate mannosyltransferase
MVQFSVLMPQPGPREAVVRQMTMIVAELRPLGGGCEVLAIDDRSDPAATSWLSDLAAECSWLRTIELDRPRGMSAALAAGIRASRGEVVLATEAGEQYLPEQIAWLLKRLARADLVMGRRQRRRWGKTYLALAQFPRRVLLGLDARDPDCLFWAARREALAGLELAPGMHRFLASLVSMRGFRVSEVCVDHHPQAGRGSEGLPSAINLFTAWRMRRRWQAILAEEAAAHRQPSPPPWREGPSQEEGRRGLAA